MSWEGFEYTPVGGLIERIQRRALRAYRKSLRPVFVKRGLTGLVLRAEALRKNSRLWCENKIAQFKRIYDNYVTFVTGAATGTQASAGSEAPHFPPAGTMGVLGA
jgi:hypothetical protein